MTTATAPRVQQAASGELWRMSATQLAALMRSRQVSSQEVIRAHLDRIGLVNPSVNAIRLVLPERALEAAARADYVAIGRDDLPPLHGVPFTVKENIDVAGTPTTHGMRAYERAFPRCDAPAVERLVAAGAIAIGRTNMPDFAVRWHTDSELAGPTLNPWNAEATPGASSGGEAVSLATGMSPLGLGNDGLGSLRWPAQCCGVIALKPTLGRIPRATTVEPIDPPIGNQLMAVDGPMARHVADLRLAFDLLAGPDVRDPWSLPVPLVGDPPALPIHVALVLDPAGLGTDPSVQAGLRAAAEALADAGYAVDEIEPPSIDGAAKAALDILNPDMRTGWAMVGPMIRPETRQAVESLFEVAGVPDPMTTMLGFIARQSLMRAWAQFQERHPLILGPISTSQPFAAGHDREIADVRRIVHDLRLTLAVNVLGLPAVALPVGVADGLPQAVQLIGPRFREDLCLDAAEALEERLGVLTPIDPR